MERLNADIIFMVCCYLDLGSLSSLAAALPHWSSVIFGTLKTRVWAIKMRILPQFTTVEYCSMLRSKCSTSRDGAEEESPRMNLVLCDWEGLQASIWKHVPFDMLKIAIFDVTQFGASELPQKLNKALRKITTSQLSLKFETRTEARKVLQTISFNPGSTIYLHELSFQAAKEPMLQQCSLENIRDLWFSGDVLSSDLSLLLGSRIPSLCVNCDCLRQSCADLVRDYIRDFLDGAVSQISCRVSASGGLLRYVFEGIAGRGETRLSSGQRRVHLFDGLEETPIHCFIDAMDDCT